MAVIPENYNFFFKLPGYSYALDDTVASYCADKLYQAVP
jgi:hypothetical protein